MTNKERYKQAFSCLHASQTISLEGSTMKNKKDLKFHLRPALAACLAAAAIVGCMGVAYAANVGGIQETFQMWFGGSAVEATVEDTGKDGFDAYQFTMTDPNGKTVTRCAGGVTVGEDGVERPLTAQEVAEGLATNVERKIDGTVWIYDHDQAFDITDYLANGQLKFTLEANGETVYYEFIAQGLAGHTRTYTPEGPVEDYLKLG